MTVVVYLRTFVVGHLGGYSPATTLANHDKFLIIIVFGTVCHNNVVNAKSSLENGQLELDKQSQA